MKNDRRLWRSSQLEFCFDAGNERPEAKTLQAQAATLLRGLDLPDLAACVRVEWNERMRTTVGRADPALQLITLNPALSRFGSDEIDRTLRHELAHLLAHHRKPRRRILPHGKEWRLACRQLGLMAEPACHRLPLPSRRLQRKYLYRCQHCQTEYPRVRPLRRTVACLDCCRRLAHGRFDARFRLQLVRR